jgi:hypothetical protein
MAISADEFGSKKAVEQKLHSAQYIAAELHRILYISHVRV